MSLLAWFCIHYSTSWFCIRHVHCSSASELPWSVISCDPQFDVDRVPLRLVSARSHWTMSMERWVLQSSIRGSAIPILSVSLWPDSCTEQNSGDMFLDSWTRYSRIMGCQAWHRQWRNCCHHPGLHSLQFLRPCRCVPAIVIALSALLPTCAPGSQQHLAGHVTEKYNRLRAKHAEWRTEGVILTTARLCKSWLD